MTSVFFSRAKVAANPQRLVVPKVDVDSVTMILDGRSRLVVATPAMLGPLFAIGRAAIDAPLAGDTVVQRVLRRDPDCIWAFLRDEDIVGGVAFLMLSAAGVSALLRGTLSVADPATRHLARAGDAPAGIYIWALVGWGRAAAAMSHGFVRLRLPRYRSATLYASPYTEAGRRFTLGMGFVACPGRRDLFQFERKAKRAPAPLPDLHVPGDPPS